MKILNKRGDSYVFTCVIVLVIAMVFSLVLFYANTMSIIKATKANTERVLDSFIMKNSVDIYQSIKQGHDITEWFDEKYYLSQISSELSLDLSGGLLYSYGTDGSVIYKMTTPKVSFNQNERLKLSAEYSLILPVYFAGNRFTDLVIPLKVTSNLTLKY